ncbi:MAG: hypothetical protein ACRYGR_06025, partial [Janthinobacterium lividum]
STGALVTAGQSVEPVGTTVTTVTNTPGLETLTFSHSLNSSLRQGEYFEYWSQYTDAQVAAMTIDYLDIQSAMANTAANGGKVQLQGGANFNMGSLGLVIPSTGINGQPTGVDINGQGEFNTKLVWIFDIGFGGYDAVGAFRLSGTTSNGSMSNLSLVGAGGSPLPGRATANATTLGWPVHRTLSHVGLSGGYASLAYSGDQTSIDHLDLGSSYYGLHYDANNSFGDFGDQMYQQVGISNTSMAGIACGPLTNCGNHSFWLRGGVFSSPYGVLKETNPAGVNTMFNGYHTDTFQMEGIGVAGYSDDQKGTNPLAESSDVIIAQSEMFWNGGSGDSLPITATTNSNRDAYIQAHYLTGKIDIMIEPGLMTPGENGIFNVIYGGMNVSGDVDTLINNAYGASSPNLQGFWSANAQPQKGAWRLHAHNWDGVACVKCNTAEYYVVASQASGSIGAAQGNATETALGISMYQGGATNSGIVAIRGVVPVMLAGNTNNYNVPLRTASNGGVIQGTGRNDANSQFIGTANDGGGTNTGTTMSVSLNPMQ